MIPQVQREDRLNADQLANYYTRTRDGELIPLSTVVTLKERRSAAGAQGRRANAVAITSRRVRA